MSKRIYLRTPQSTIYKRVRRGAKLLDEKASGWEKKIERDLNMSSPNSCVLGQVFGNYVTGLAKLNLPLDGTDRNIQVAHGFEQPYPTEDGYWPRLEATWRRLLARRNR